MSDNLINKNKKKICLVNPTLIVRRPLKEMAPLLVEKGYEVGVMIPKNFKKNLYSEFVKKNKKICLHEYNVINTPLSQFEWPIPLLKFWFLSFKILWHYDVVQIWSNFYLNNFLLILLSYFFPRTKVILTMDTIPGYSFKSSKTIDKALKIYTRSICKLQFWRANKITLYGKSLLPHTKKAGLPLKKTVVIPTGLTFYKRPSKESSLRKLAKLLGMSVTVLKENKIVSFIGLMNDRKGVDLLLKVASKFKDENVLFLLAGSGPNLKKYKEIVMRFGLNKIRFLGYTKEKKYLLELSDVFFFPSIGEGLAGVLMEAMYQEATILTTKIPCTTDLIKSGKEGVLLPIDDEKGFEKELRRLLNDERLRTKLREAAYKKIVNNFDWAKVLKQYQGVYDE